MPHQREILFASQNEHKVNEVRALMPEDIRLLGLKDIQWTLDIPEPFDSYEANAKSKAYFVYHRTGISCFADDSGLEVDALNARPGVMSARYAGLHRNHDDNIEKVLDELNGIDHRAAQFISVIAFIDEKGEIHMFKGHIHGTITASPLGNGGFGYDPIFIPDGFKETFGQLPEHLKNRISHRAIAMKHFVDFLTSVR